MSMDKTRSSNSRGTKRRAGRSSKLTFISEMRSGKAREPKPTQNPRPGKRAKNAKQSENKPTQLSKLGCTTPLSIAFRKIEPTWRNYIEYAAYAAKEGDEDMQKVVEVWNALPTKEKNSIMPEQVCSLAGVLPGVLVAAVSRYYWEQKHTESVISISSEHPKVLDKTAHYAKTRPFADKDRELFFRLSGSLPDKKGTSIVINANPQVANFSTAPPPAGANGFRPMDQRVIEMGKLLDAPDEDNIVSVPMFGQNTADVLETVDTEED
jgi:hypothetical protein